MSNSNFNVHRAFAQYFSQDELNPWLYRLSQAIEAGNVCLDVRALQDKGEEENDIKLDAAILSRHPLVGKDQDMRPFILHQDKLYLHRFFHYEKGLVAQIKALLYREDQAASFNKLLKYQDLLRKGLFSNNAGLRSTDWQKVACINAFLNNFSIISGGPGTGKTTTVTKLLALFLNDDPDLKVSICAPTGKAAARLEESISQAEGNFKGSGIPGGIIEKITALKASTIHSLLGFRYNSIEFKHNAGNTLDTDVLIVDECSMIDMALFYKLFQAIDHGRTRVILLGDKDQLASVDAGSVFRDLCSDTAELNRFPRQSADFINHFFDDPLQMIPDSHLMSGKGHALLGHVIELRTSYRFSDKSGIGQFSKAILNNETAMLPRFLNNEDEHIVFRGPEELERCLQEAMALLDGRQNGYIGRASIDDKLQHITNSTILCAVKDGRSGLRAINNEIVRSKFDPSGRFFADQLIMVTENQASEGIYNGDMGLVQEGATGLSVHFSKAGGRSLSLSPAQIHACETAFAMTIHKSQGSEFNEVLIILPDNKDNLLLSRELLYTAITRAKKKVTIVSKAEVIYAIANKTVKRVSGIADHF